MLSFWVCGQLSTIIVNHHGVPAPKVQFKCSHPETILRGCASEEHARMVTGTIDWLQQALHCPLASLSPLVLSQFSLGRLNPACFPPGTPEYKGWLEKLPQHSLSGTPEYDDWFKKLLEKLPQCSQPGTPEYVVWLEKVPQRCLSETPEYDGWLKKHSIKWSPEEDRVLDSAVQESRMLPNRHKWEKISEVLTWPRTVCHISLYCYTDTTPPKCLSDIPSIR